MQYVVSSALLPPTDPSAGTVPLADLAPGASARVALLATDAFAIDWLRAVGIAEGQHVTVLRRAPFGGPLHVRAASGGEFAIDRSLARTIRVAPLGARDAVAADSSPPPSTLPQRAAKAGESS